MRIRKALVIGGTGTVGIRLVQELLAQGAETVRIFSRDEYKQYLLANAWSAEGRCRFLLGDVRDRDRLLRAMEGVEAVFHLAALKHVPQAEYNPFEAVKTNVVGTQNVIECAMAQGVSAVLYASSDKAASPTNVMGATKLLGERIVSAAQFHTGPREMRFMSVRFGNVLGSRGSVVHLFAQRAREGRALPVTHPEMSRFVMSVDRTTELMLQAMDLSVGGETFVFKMPVVRLGDLAEVLWRRDRPGEPLRMDQIGLRPGEKMFEELMTEEESHRALETESMFLILPFGKNPEARVGRYPGAWVASPGEYRSDGQRVLPPEETARLVEEMWSALGRLPDMEEPRGRSL
ncbi:MAG TPA: polysaccharide biosynthesis protein [Synergistaceae bacterium]|nr:polysaccharide biosynthesis protein [Synergistaceae bacterium]